MIDVLVDANYLIALAYPKDKNHKSARQFVESTDNRLFIPDVILPEAMYNIRRLGGINAAIRFGSLLSQESTPLLALTLLDLNRAMAIMQQYRDADLDFVDCCLTAIAERLNITHICTFDRRDFLIIRPQHADYFELLP